MRDKPLHSAQCIGLGGLIRSVGKWQDGGKGVTLGHALRRTDNDTLLHNFSLICV